MAKITNLIPLQNFEIVRDQIAAILSLELANQAALAVDPLLNPVVYTERSVPFDKSNMPALNVMLSRGNYPSNTTTDSDGVYTYFVDLYSTAKSSPTKRGDTLSTTRLHRLLGLVRAILEDSQYITLGFARPSIEHTAVQDIGIEEPKDNKDALSTMMGRVTFSVRVPETIQLLIANPIDGFDTSVTLNESNSGYVFSGDIEGLLKPTNLALTILGNTSIKLDWNDNATTELNYEIWRGTDCDNLVLIDTIPADSVTYTDIGLTAATAYLYKVRAINGALLGDFSDIAVGCTTGGAIPVGIVYLRPLLTGQTTSVRTGDDAWHLSNGTYNYNPPTNPISYAQLDTAHAFPLLNLISNNAFGNKNRFTDTAGNQNYDGTGGSIIDYAIDHLTGLGRTIVPSSALNWNSAIDAAVASTFGGFSDWRIPNMTENEGIGGYELDFGLDYSPFDTNQPASGENLWSSTLNAIASTRAYTVRNQVNSSIGFFAGIQLATVTLRYYQVRNHYS